ncbi:grasp-with-spasm system SPASM domain peptide maturase [Chryseobacterium lathyri]|uniref:grasp-with-spasm system SPASM domain peptide maturase n=1 Tax=Chryseobacterium lathyri TaxID=395933 RepID=UPI0027805852|nr:grasp-with-spasm system SPASM domain peptide maturase [Chryseobacterium lathyri]MDQ0064669.1 SPASM domain peptide maturase of grasp-with-spasm system [Chryseobacterium lathyri]
MKQYFELYQDCFIIKGAKNILLCDFHFNKILDITDYYNLFIDEYYFPVEDHLLEIISFFEEEGFGTTKSNYSSKMLRKQFKWRSASKINEVIIEHRIEDNFDVKKVYKIIEDLSASFIQIRFLEFSFSKLKEILSLLELSSIRTVEVLLPYLELSHNKKVIDLLAKNSRIMTVYFYNAHENKSIIDNEQLFTIIYYEKNLTNPKNCGIISEDYFLNDIKNISKSKTVNNCLYGKLFISNDGILKNCPSTQKTLDNINNVSVETLLSKVHKEKERLITKDQVEICKDCEYRYFCTDCRVYREDPENIFSKPLKCGYDPYIGIWEDWSKNPLKKKAIKYYDFKDFN